MTSLKISAVKDFTRFIWPRAKKAPPLLYLLASGRVGRRLLE